jgi:biofilm PGA synthesis protein PgaD
MEESRSRPGKTIENGDLKMPEIIIEDRPELRGPARNTIEWVVTTLMWALWIYLFLPVATMILWAAGAHFIYHSVFEHDALSHLRDMLIRLGWAVALIFAVLSGWRFYNYYRFGRLNRRKRSASVSTADLAAFFGLSESQLRAIQEEKEVYWGFACETCEAGSRPVDRTDAEERKTADPVRGKSSRLSLID